MLCVHGRTKYPEEVVKKVRRMCILVGENRLCPDNDIGLDEIRGVIGADNTELAIALSVKACFDGYFPK